MATEAPAPEAQAPPAPKKGRRWWPWLLGIPLSGLVLAVLALALLPRIITGERLRDELVSALTERLGVPVELGALRYGLGSGVELGPIRIGPPPGYTEDIFTAERLALHYQLGGLVRRRLVISELSLSAAVLTLEKKDGQTGLDYILGRLAGPASEAPPPTSSPPASSVPGPLSPITVVLDGVRIGPLTTHLVGEGPTVHVGQLLLLARGQLDPERLSARLELTLLPPDSAANLKVALPGPSGAIEATARLEERAVLEVEALTAHGLALRRVDLDLSTQLSIERAQVAEVQLPVGRWGLSTRVALRPGDDRSTLETLQATLDDQPLLAAQAQVEGLSALLEGLLGAPAARALGTSIGLVRRQDSERVHLQLSTLSLPLGRLAPYGRAFVPGLALDGRIALEAVELEGPVAALLAGTPTVFAGVLSFENVQVALPSSGLVVGRLDGALQTRQGSKSGPYGLGGTLTLHGLRQGEISVARVQLEPSVELERLAYPPPGRAELGIGVRVAEVGLPGVAIAEAGLTAKLRGTELLQLGRAADPPISVELGLDAKQVAVQAGGLSVPRTELSLQLSLDRLLEPSVQPITGRLELRVPRYQDQSGNTLAGVRLSGPLSLGDPRQAYFDAGADLRLDVASVNTPGASIEGLRLRAAPRAQRIGAQALSRFFQGQPAPSKLPARVSVGLELNAERLVSGQGDDRLETKVAANAELGVDFLAATAELKHLELGLDDWLMAHLSLQARDLYAEAPDLKAHLVVDRLDLGAAVRKAPKSALVAAPDLSATGRIQADLSVAGRLPRTFGKLDLEQPPLSGSLTLAFEQVGAESAALGNRVEGLNGKILASLGVRRVSGEIDLRSGKLQLGRGDAMVQSMGASFVGTLGLKDRLLFGQTRLETQALQFGAQGASQPGALMVADFSYPLGDDVELNNFELKLPMAGLDAKLWGRLSRQQYGVLRPDLSAELSVDVDRLNTLARSVPALQARLLSLAPASGKLRSKIEILSKSDTRVELQGMLNLDQFSYKTPNLQVVRATGRLPIDQSVLLPAPTFNLARAAAFGALGDDLEARLAELGARFAQAKAMVDTVNILQVAPRTADHAALQPYYDKRGAEMVIERLSFKETVLKNVHVEGAWDSGVLRVDRFQAGVWDGYFLGDLAMQLSPDLDVRMRMRGVATRLNLDIPYSQAKGIPPETDPSEKEKYLASGTLDLSFGLRERAINGKIDVLQVSLPQVDRLFGALDPRGESPAVGALRISERAGVRPVAAKIWISQNLLNVQFEWQRLWVHVAYKSWNPVDLLIDTILIPGRLVLVPTLGGLYVIPLVNNAIRRFGIGNVIDSMVGGMKLEAYPNLAQGWVIAREEDAGTAVAGP